MAAETIAARKKLELVSSGIAIAASIDKEGEGLSKSYAVKSVTVCHAGAGGGGVLHRDGARSSARGPRWVI
jgi:hypothetical protein